MEQIKYLEVRVLGAVSIEDAKQNLDSVFDFEGEFQLTEEEDILIFRQEWSRTKQRAKFKKTSKRIKELERDDTKMSDAVELKEKLLEFLDLK